MHHGGVTVVPGSLTAILEKAPGRPRGDRFLVIVDVDSDAGCLVELVAAVPQGINPLIKLMRVRLEAPATLSGRPARRTLRYEEAPPGADYREVWLGEGDAALSAKVALVM